MIDCTNDVVLILGVVKDLMNILKYAMPIILIIWCTVDVFRIIISKEESEIKKYRKCIYNRVIYCIVLFLVPTIIFLLLNLIITDNDIANIGDVQNCFNRSNY